MSLHHFQYRSTLPTDLTSLFAWHERPGALERLIPPWDSLQVIRKAPHIRQGAGVDLRMQAGPLPFCWRARHTGYEKDCFFRDEQERGPFRTFVHSHRFQAEPDGRATLTDAIDFELPLGPVGDLFSSRIKRQLQQTFAYRHHVLEQDIIAHHQASGPPLTILVSGASGVVGRSLVPFLTTGGHRVIRLVRRRPAANDELHWNPTQGIVDLAPLDHLDAVIHLAGENIGNRRWSAAKKKQILTSRTRGTRLLAQAVAARQQKPAVFLSASAIGYYGHRGSELLSEESGMGTDFISQVCGQWEQAARPAAEAGIRLALLRIGIALTPKGGALRTMLGPARFGLLGPLGEGSQYTSWLSINDLIWAIHHIMVNESLQGPVNICAPQAVTNRDFVRTLGSKIGRPAMLRIPAWLLRLRFGEMAKEVPLASTRVTPQKLLASGFSFRYPSLSTALDYLLGTIC